MHGSDRVPDLNIDSEASLGWQSKSNGVHESEMALFFGVHALQVYSKSA